MAKHPATIILNPVSGQGNPDEHRMRIIQAARQHNWDGQLIETTPTRLTNLIVAEEVQKGSRHFVICGGDGTITEVLEAVINRDVTVGIVPLGTGNLLAKNLNLPLDIDQAVKVALLGQLTSIDIGQANHVYFAIMAGMGLDAQIMQQTNRRLKNIFGQLAYFGVGLKNLMLRSGRFVITVDGQSRKITAKSVLVANLGKMGHNIEAVPHTNKDDGQLKIGIIQAKTWLQFIDLLLATLKGDINASRHYQLLQGHKVKIVPLDGPQPFQCDGNDYPPVDTLTITIHPHALRIMTSGQ